jgi:PAS domain S-box-containing protein
MRILVADDHAVVRRGVVSLLTSQAGYDVCGEALDGQDAVEKARALQPDIIVMDVSMPNLNGLEATRTIRREIPDIEILILSQHESAEMVRQAFNAGARGYVVKSSIADHLLNAVEAVGNHESFFDGTRSQMSKNPSRRVDEQDILQRSAILEQALRESEELYRSTFELAAVGVAHVSPEGRWLRVNPKLCEIIGYSQEELLNLRFQDLTHPDDLAPDMEQAEKVVAGSLDQYSMEKRYIRKDGSLRWVNLTVSSVRDANKKFKHFISVIEDITARKESEQSRSRLAFAEQARFRLAAIVESSDDAIISKDLNGIITSWNSAAERIFGYEAEEVIGKSITILIPPELLDEETKFLQRLRKGERIDHYETTRLRKNGARLLVSLTISPVRDAEGRVVGASKIARNITGQREYEQLVEKSEDRLRTALEVASAGVWDHDLAANKVFWSPTVYSLLGYQPGECEPSAENWQRRVHPDDLPRVLPLLAQAKNGKGYYQSEYRTLWPDGTIHWLSANGRFFFDAQKQPVRFLGAFTEITRRKAGELALRESEQRFRAFFHSAAVGAARADFRTSRFLDVNDTFCEMTGYSREELLSLTFIDITHPEDRALSPRGNAQPYEAEKRYVRKNGEIIWVHGAINCVSDELGVPLYYVAIIADITDRRKEEQSRREAEERTRFSLEAAGVGTWEWDLIGGTVRWSENMEKVHRQASGSFGGSFESFLANVHPDDRSRIPQLVQQAISGDGKYHVEYRQIGADGSLGWMEGIGQVIYDDSGKPIRMMGICTDITERKSAEDALRSAHDELEQRVLERTTELVLKNEELTQKSAVIRDLSRRSLQIQDEERRRIAREMHDSVGQLLAAMSMNFAHALNECQKLSPLASKALFDNAQLLEQATSEVRTLSHLLHPPLLEEAGITTAIHIFVEGFSERSKIHVTCDLPENIGPLPKEIEITLFRIIQEALTNIHRHSASTTATIRICREESQVKLEISDAGHGIPHNKLQLVNSSSGSGVGIRGMRERLQQLGGDLLIESDSDGTTLRATLPVAGETKAINRLKASQ